MSEEGTEFAGLERRNSRRRPSPVNRLIRAEVSAQNSQAEALYLYLVDMSEGGLRINAERPLPPDSPVLLSFGLEGFCSPPSPNLAVTVQRAWDRTLAAGTWVSGLKFVDLSEEAMATVQSLLQGFTPEGKRQRFRLREPISVSVQVEPEGAWVVVVPMDLCLTGVRVRAYLREAVANDDLVGLMVRFPDQRGHVLQARVRSARALAADRQEAELVFVDPPAEVTRAVQAYIDQVCGVSTDPLE